MKNLVLKLSVRIGIFGNQIFEKCDNKMSKFYNWTGFSLEYIRWLFLKNLGK